MNSSKLNEGFQKDIDDIAQIPVIQTMLSVICRSTGMGFAAIARVTEDTWLACAVRDEISFGLLPGDELKIKTTICDEIRGAGKGVVIDNVPEDEVYKDHPTPAMYGFKSYISIPIIRRNGTFFGTLCAIDPAPNKLRNTATVDMFHLFSELIAFHLEAVEQISITQTKLLEERAFNDFLETKVRECTLELQHSREIIAENNRKR